MAQKISINIKHCNIDSSEAHNRRSLVHIYKENSTSAQTSWWKTKRG